MSAADHVTYRLRNAIVSSYPYPHFYVENVFPDQFYRDLLTSLPDAKSYSERTTRYHGRQFADPNENPALAFMNSSGFLSQIMQIFMPWVEHRYGNNKLELFHDLRLVRDGQGYQIGPHTDAAWKLVSLLFYLPDDYALDRLGTSIYTPKDPKFTCPGGPHHPFPNFNLVYTAPFVPNTCFGFWKTNQSFHGVEPITIPCTRNVLLYNVYDSRIYAQMHQSKG